MSYKREVPQREFALVPGKAGDMSQGFGFTSNELNMIYRNGFMDEMDFYQRKFGVYSTMNLNKLRKFIVHSIKGNPLMWQTYQACNHDYTGSYSMDKIELTPVAVTMHERLCMQEEILNSCFAQWLTWTNQGEVTLDQEAYQLFNLLVDEILVNTARGARMSLTSGQYYDVNAVQFAHNTTQQNIVDFKKTHGTVQGWIPLVKQLALAQYGHLNVPGLLAVGDFTDAGYQGDIETLFDELKSRAPKPLQRLVNNGRMTTTSRTMYPLFVVSDAFYASVVTKYNAQANQVATNRVRIRKEIDGGMAVYYIDEVPVVNIEEINGFDQYVKPNINFAGIVASGNIHLGISFGGIPTDIENPNPIAVKIATVDDITRTDNGTTHWVSNALMKSYIADADYMVSTIIDTQF